MTPAERRHVLRSVGDWNELDGLRAFGPSVLEDEDSTLRKLDHLDVREAIGRSVSQGPKILVIDPSRMRFIGASSLRVHVEEPGPSPALRLAGLGLAPLDPSLTRPFDSQARGTPGPRLARDCRHGP